MSAASASKAPSGKPDLVIELSRFAAGIDAAKLDATVVEAVKANILDTLSCALAGSSAKAIPELPAADRLAKLSQELNGAEYFAVTELAEFNAQPDLKRCLESRYPVVASGDRFVVYDLR